MTFEDGGAYITADYCTEGEKTRVHIVTNRWAVQVKRFVTELP
jgi:hypothetical protein